MGEGSLSQEEIDALLAGEEEPQSSSVGQQTSYPPQEAPGGMSNDGQQGGAQSLPAVFQSALSEISSSCSTFVGKSFGLTSVNITDAHKNQIITEIQPDSMIVSASIQGQHTILIFSKEQAQNLAMHMMSLQELPQKFDDVSLSVFNEIANVFLSNLAPILSRSVGGNASSVIHSVQPYTSPEQLSSLTEEVSKISYGFVLENQNMGFIVQLMDSNILSQWNTSILRSNRPSNANMGQPSAGQFAPSMQKPLDTLNINSVNFPTLQDANVMNEHRPQNYELLLDVQMSLTVELGRTTKYIKDILNLGEGSIIELDKLAGEPVDLLVNGKLIAKGEVVIIDENFGVRVTDIIGPAERLSQLDL